jgi:diacylglycerol kinase (ATP)
MALAVPAHLVDRAISRAQGPNDPGYRTVDGVRGWHDTTVSTAGRADPLRRGGSPQIALVVNPAARRGAALRTAQRVVAALGPGTVRLITPGAGAAASVRALVEAAANSDSIWVCGGDGMVHLAVNVLAGSQVPLGIVPAGTGNDAAAMIGIDPDPVRAAHQLLAAARSGAVRRVDLGWSDGPSLLPGGARRGPPPDWFVPAGHQQHTGRWFLGMLYAGLDSAVNERANTLRWPRGRHKYDIAIVMEMLRLRPAHITLTVDEEVIEVPATLVAIGNGPRYGGGKVMVPTARWDDGYLDITLVGPVSRTTLARLAPTLPRAGHIGHPAVRQFRARAVGIAGGGPVAYADGERVGPLPISTYCVPQALSLLVPPEREVR